jgi:hypothetical protein
MMIKVGVVSAAMAAAGQANGVRSSAIILATSVGNASGWGAVRSYAARQGAPAKRSGVICSMPARTSGYIPSLV